MSTTPAAPPVANVSVPGATPASSTGAWLGSQSIFDRPDERKVGRAFTTSFIIHLSILLLLVLAARTKVAKAVQSEVINMVFLPAPGPSGGGGGSPTPRPKVTPPKATVTPEAAPVVAPPTLTVESQTFQTSGLSSVGLATYAGGGSGGGVGSGTGNGVGPGTGGGFGGGAYAPGNGISDPVPLKQVRPEYTPDAMRAKVQGVADVDVVVQPDGTVSDAKISRSLDRVYGLDDKALEAAKRWLFRPARDRSGKAVAVLVTIELTFTLH